MSPAAGARAGEQRLGPSGTSPAILTGPLVGRHPEYRRAVQQVERYARYEPAVVLLEGESGTGKSYFARHLHACSARASRAYEHVVLSTLDDNLAASDLFGHVMGAYTDARTRRAGRFASADGGTLFLDEIGKASPAVQRRLLHVVEHGELWPVGADRAVRVNVRLVTATNIPLPSLVASGSFLDDLMARVSGFRIRIPPLRERASDIPALVAHFVTLRAAACGYAHPPVIDASLLEALCAAAWPGNLRQLDAAIQRLLVDAEGASCVGLRHLMDGTLGVDPAGPSLLTARRVHEIVRQSGSKAAAARTLGVTRTTIYKYLGAAPDLS